GGHGLEIAGPAAARIEFGVRGEQRGAAADADVGARLGGVPVAAREGPLGVLQSRDCEFVGGKLRPPFGVGARDLVHEEPVRSYTSILHLNRLSSGWPTPSGGRADAAMRSGPGSWQQIAPGCDNMTPVHVFIAS